MITTNLLGPIRLTGALLPLLSRQPRSTIMTVSSGLAFLPPGHDTDLLRDQGRNPFLHAIASLAVEGNEHGGYRTDSALRADASDGPYAGRGSAGHATCRFSNRGDADFENAAQNHRGVRRAGEAAAIRRRKGQVRCDISEFQRGHAGAPLT